ncbi:hypothetical protein PRIPAC_73488 [Pristionchus pacificus]|nr:hypothetical protein PRIPAC_73488 [Pristionchus pacificus]
MARVKTRELRGKPKEALNKTLEEQKTELASLAGLQSHRWSCLQALQDQSRPQEHRPRSDRDQPNPEAGAEKVLQGKEVPAHGHQIQEDPCYASRSHQARGFHQVGQAARQDEKVRQQKVRRQGLSCYCYLLSFR